MRMDPDDESDDMGRFDSHPGDLENGALGGADGDSDSCDDSEEHQGPDSAEPEAPPPSPESTTWSVSVISLVIS